MPKALRRALVAVPVLLVAAYALLVWYVWLNENSGLYLGADLSAVSQLTVDGDIPAPWDTLRVTTEDGISIVLLESWQPDAPGAPWVVYFYGQEGSLADRWNIDRYHLFRRTRLNVLAVEYRGYGASEKTQPTEEGLYADARAAWRHLSETRGVPARRVLLYGFSLGSGVATQLATEMSPAALVTEGAFTSIPDMFRIQYPWITTVAMRNRFENLEKAKSLPVQWLIFHGRGDEKVPFTHAEALAATGGGPRRLEPLDCGHDTALESEGDRIERILADFVVSVFGATRGSEDKLESS